jgi:hypothetical protein
VPDESLRTTDDVVNAIQACAHGRLVLAANAMFSTTLTMRIGDDGLVQSLPVPRFSPPLPPEVQECVASVIYKRSKLTTPGDVSLPIEFKP